MVRKDPKGRKLEKGESYRSDKKLYIYQYQDALCQMHTIYASDLKELRKKEEELTRDRLDDIQSYVATKTTLNYAYDRYISLKHDIQLNTKANYNYVYDHFVRSTIGKRIVSTIKYSDIKSYYWQLMNDWGVSPMTVDNVHTLLHPTFQMCVRDGIIRTNPSSGVMTEIKKSKLWKKGKREALSVDQTKAFMGYMRNHETFSHWENLLTVMFGTGMRVGEICGLRWDDLDYEKKEIHVTHNLQYTRWEGEDYSARFHLLTPKTENSVRTIPMLDEVYKALKVEYSIQEETGFCTATVDGVSGFVFRNRFGGLYHQQPINRAIKRIYESYNAEEILRAAKEKRKPLLIPDFSCHHIRHTFCTRLCEREKNVKAIQGIMGHADIQTTLDIYAEATDTMKHEAMEALQTGNDIF